MRNTNPDKCGWRVNEWATDVGLGRAFVYQLMNQGEIKSVKVGGARIIVTPPRDYLARCDTEI
jgi:predicted DNA-binding transcriptional regulator AlpA